MPIFRVEKSNGYTVMSNHHLRNKELTLKAKGLLSQMLSLPDDWDYTLKGLAFINREQIDAIREAVKELETAGYIVRSRERDEKGRLRGADYVIYETPQPASDLPTLENPTLDNPTQDNPTLENPTLENPTQLNKDIQRTNLPKKEKSNTDVSTTDSIPFPSLNPSPCDVDGVDNSFAATPPERKRREMNDAFLCRILLSYIGKYGTDKSIRWHCLLPLSAYAESNTDTLPADNCSINIVVNDDIGFVMNRDVKTNSASVTKGKQYTSDSYNGYFYVVSTGQRISDHSFTAYFSYDGTMASCYDTNANMKPSMRNIVVFLFRMTLLILGFR